MRLRRNPLRALAAVALLLAAGSLASGARAHNVGQIDTAIYLDPATQSMLIARAMAGGGGLRMGDVLTYIIECVPVENGATVGAGGYVTAYIPAGTGVIGADFVIRDGAGGFTQTTPNLPGVTWTGLGADPLVRCEFS